ncbi:MAG: hypothetical protein H6977_09430 [Gammaproteobacteria bacterium]|nr:hypothetical protein [Gammaproteobacteria bacterium]MCP5200225.1 hypothetical protein [Gammaproteobacteria bacterium]
MRDGIALARAGRPAVAFVTSKFEPQGEFVARAEGMPEVPQVIVPHPVAGIGADAMAALADDIADEVIRRLREG